MPCDMVVFLKLSSQVDPESELPMISVNSDEWVLVKYDDGLYPGEVRELGDIETEK